MPKSTARPEIYILLLLGFEPIELMNMGFSKGSVYKYNAELPKVILRMKEALRRKD